MVTVSSSPSVYRLGAMLQSHTSCNCCYLDFRVWKHLVQVLSSSLQSVSVAMLPGPLSCFAMSRSACLAQESWTQLDLETEISLSVSREEIRPWRKWSFICSKSGGKFRRGDFHGLYLGREKQSETLWPIKLYTKANESFTTLKLTFGSPLTGLWNPSLTRSSPILTS